ncbi:MAG: histidine kinase [Acidimicrobiia bacterium]|nr:histidine kinase [Acidimicrobiia bacterium]
MHPILLVLLATQPFGYRRRRRRSWRLGRRALANPTERSVQDTLRLTYLAARPLREGLDDRSATRAARAIRELIGVAAVAITNTEEVLAYSGMGHRHHGVGDHEVFAVGDAAIRGGGSRASKSGLVCDRPDCPIGETVAVPLWAGSEAIGSLILLRMKDQPVTLGLIRSARELTRQLSNQLQLAEGDITREELSRARTVALRAQISPHFAYNTLTAIGSMVRKDAERARELLIQFAEFSRYILRNDRINTTLSDELRNVHTYLELQRARHGDRLEVVFRVDPEVLATTVPMLLLQPLVENAVQHGLEKREGIGLVTIDAEDRDDDVYLSVSDNGVGMTPEAIAAIRDFAKAPGEGSVGLANIQERLRSTYGEHYGLIIESEPGRGTTVSVLVPKYRAGVIQP